MRIRNVVLAAVGVALALAGCVVKPGDAAVQRGSTYFRQGRFDDARSCYEAALSEDSSYSEGSICVLISNTYFEQRDYGEAIRWRERARETAPDDEQNLLNLAFLYRLVRDDETAEPLLIRATELAPEDPAAFASLASLYMTAGRTDEALAALTAANALDGRIAVVHANLAICHAKKGDFDRAEAEYEQAQKLKADNLEQFRAELDAIRAAAGQ